MMPNCTIHDCRHINLDTAFVTDFARSSVKPSSRKVTLAYLCLPNLPIISYNYRNSARAPWQKASRERGHLRRFPVAGAHRPRSTVMAAVEAFGMRAAMEDFFDVGAKLSDTRAMGYAAMPS